MLCWELAIGLELVVGSIGADAMCRIELNVNDDANGIIITISLSDICIVSPIAVSVRRPLNPPLRA